MSESAEHHGRCLCGAVRVTVTGALGNISACHCDMCKRWSGSIFMGIEVDRGRVKISGPVKTYQSSPFAARGWCELCGSALWFGDTEGRHGDVLELAPGLFDNAGGARLTREVYADRCPEGYALAGDHQRVSRAEYEAENKFVEDAG
ncbi:GFA family protein [Sulfitobacter aestuarii]|uniref:GFA family protein n=1 Tax=Sulfitobacter aestuarii TaxID=2161676 RepID=A0ABW5TXH8_9RHOB